MNLRDAACIVTGSAVGIGAACAKRLAARGARVAVNCSKSLDAAEETAAACRAAGGDAMVVQADVAKDGDCRHLVRTVIERWGRLDALVNNAGTTKFTSHTDLDALEAADFHRIYGVNVVGPYQMIRAALPHLRAAGPGAVVNISSIAGLMGGGSSIAYAASKGALNTLTLSLARALGPDIRVNAVCPGFVETRWLREGYGESLYDKLKSGYEAKAVLNTVMSPDDIADAVLWLIEGARHVTGEVLTVDGGFYLGRR